MSASTKQPNREEPVVCCCCERPTTNFYRIDPATGQRSLLEWCGECYERLSLRAVRDWSDTFDEERILAAAKLKRVF